MPSGRVSSECVVSVGLSYRSLLECMMQSTGHVPRFRRGPFRLGSCPRDSLSCHLSTARQAKVGPGFSVEDPHNSVHVASGPALAHVGPGACEVQGFKKQGLDGGTSVTMYDPGRLLCAKDSTAEACGFPMTTVPYAAFHPIFFLHHSNCDRIYEKHVPG